MHGSVEPARFDPARVQTGLEQALCLRRGAGQQNRIKPTQGRAVGVVQVPAAVRLAFDAGDLNPLRNIEAGAQPHRDRVHVRGSGEQPQALGKALHAAPPALQRRAHHPTAHGPAEVAVGRSDGRCAVVEGKLVPPPRRAAPADVPTLVEQANGQAAVLPQTRGGQPSDTGADDGKTRRLSSHGRVLILFLTQKGNNSEA